MIHVSIWIEDHMLSTQYFATEIADKDFPVRQESLTFNKSQLFHRTVNSSVCLPSWLSALTSVYKKVKGNIYM